jgi:N6-L-threonylcarbamoyladenine synthase
MAMLAFETSCDETSAAVVRDGMVLASAVSSQVRLHAEYGGVVPELAAREHLRNFIPVARAALEAAGLGFEQIGAVAATQGPGLPGALLIGLKAAQAVAFARRLPFFAIHHHEAHIYSAWISGSPPRAEFELFEPNVALVVSGGHTLLVLVRQEFDHTVLGGTMDDAAGECFDKTGKLLGLGYPAGPELDLLAEQGNPAAFSFPRPMIEDPGNDFSFSGLKTSVRYFLRDHTEIPKDADRLRDLCASVRKAIVDVLVTKTVRAAMRHGMNCITASGGVSCNRLLRRELENACAQRGLKLRLAPTGFCTDNAAMVGVVAERKWLGGDSPTGLDDDIKPGWTLPEQRLSAI